MSVLTSTLDVELSPLHEKPLQSCLKGCETGKSNIYTRTWDGLDPHHQPWRPSFHLTAPQGWLNDPCGLGYDLVTGLYHLAFQWNPWGNDWGNMSWGHATSTDLVSWKISPRPMLTPSAEYDRCGVFTGCLQPTDLRGHAGALTAIYTSVRLLPIHYTLPYVRGCESLSIALSRDGGETWERQNCNPILPGPPADVNVTGWRDPYVTAWTGRQQTVGSRSSPALYGFISGGISGRTPTVFVYAVQPTDLRKWEYLGPLVDVGVNLRPSRWSGDLGMNWEVANMMTLTNAEGASRDFVIMGVEGCLPCKTSSPGNETGSAWLRRDARAQSWMSVTSQESNGPGNALVTYSFSGIFDHGCLYAANSFWDPQTSQQIVFGWIMEEDVPDRLRHRQGWSGMTSLPRTVRLLSLHDVKKARSSPLASITSVEAVPNVSSSSDTFTVHTLGIRPDSRLARLRHGAQKITLSSLPRVLDTSPKTCLPMTTARWELDAEIEVRQSCARVGIEIAHSADFQNRSILSWDPRTETFKIERPTVEDTEINHGWESAPHTLFTRLNERGEEVEETLRVHAFFDASVLEVFVNERTAISTRIYHASDRCFGLRFFAHACDGDDQKPAAVLLRADVWDGLGVE